MEVVYGIIEYTAQDKTADYFADIAVGVLKELEKQVLSVLPVFLSSNSVLTISGARAFDAYHSYPDYISADDIKVAEAVLKNHKIYVTYESRLFNRSNAKSFELLNEIEFLQLWKRYKFPQDAFINEIPLKFKYKAENLTAWMEMTDVSLANIMENNILPRSWLNDWYSPYDFRFGMMFGYPAKAIESLIWSKIGLQHEKNMAAKISCADAYYAAQPIYEFDPKLAADPEIVVHQTLWSEILLKVYDSEWHKQLKQKTGFMSAVEKFAKYDKTA